MKLLSHPIARLLRLDKPVGILLLLWPCWWAFCLVNTDHFDLQSFLIFSCGVFVMRAAGCIMNDIADRKFDGHVKRTKARVLVSQEITLKGAFAILCLLLLWALLLVWQLNEQTRRLAVIALLLAAIYPFMKRYFSAPQLILGIAFSWSIPMVFSATETTLTPAFWCLCIASVLWPFIYDTFYALVDKEDDLKIGIKSTAILFGEYYQSILFLLQSCFALIWFVLFPALNPVSHIYYAMMLLVLLIMIYQMQLVSVGEREKAFQAFKISAWQGGIIFIALFFGIP